MAEGKPEVVVKEEPKDFSFFHERLDPLGWTPERNFVVFPADLAGDGKRHEYPLFDADKDQNIVIPYYRITGQPAEYRKEGDKWGKPYVVKRLLLPRIRPDGSVEKYKNPSGTGTLPWFPPEVINAYNAGAEIDTLVLTEGQLKAFAGAVQGVMMVGLSGIHNAKNQSTGMLHADVISLLKRCKPKQVVFLQDGDCKAFPPGWPEDPDKDLYYKPNLFFSAARNLGELLKDHARTIGFRSYFMHVVSDSIDVPAGTAPPKGFDDLLLAYQESKVLAAAHRVTKDAEPILPAPEKRIELRAAAIQEVVQDLISFSGGPCRFFERRDLDRPDKLRDYFHLRREADFYAAYQERIGDREFVYDGTKYQWSEADKELKVKVPSVAKKYVRVGTDYFKYIKKRNPHSKQLEEHLAQWKKSTIIEDNSKHFLTHIEKLEAFVNYPDHVSYQRVIDNCLNSYGRFLHTPDPDAEPPVHTLKFLRHIFGAGTVEVPHPKEKKENGEFRIIKVSELDLGLDYLKLIYERPTQMLPILCLISKERSTGKTTFFDYLQTLLGLNCTQIGAKDLESDFNGHYASKKCIIIDEALISKAESVEKLKSLSTAKMIMVNNKGLAQYAQAFFGTFLIGSNNIRSFIRTDDDEVRFWVRKVPKIPDEDLDIKLFEKMVDEIPAFLHYIGQRAFATEDLFRSWFHPPLLVTEALLDVRRHSVSSAKRTIEGWIRGIFWAKQDLQRILMTTADIKREMFVGQRVDEKYIREVLKEELGVEKYRNAQGKEATTPYSYWRVASSGETIDLVQVKNHVSSRPYEFRRQDFVSPEEEKAIAREIVAPDQTAKPGVEKPQLATAGDMDENDLPF
jgi:hypothetical protein